MKRNSSKVKIFLANIHNGNNPGDMAINYGAIELFLINKKFCVSSNLRSRNKCLKGDPEKVLSDKYPSLKLYRPIYAHVDGFKEAKLISILKTLIFVMMLFTPCVIFKEYVKKVPVLYEIYSSNIIVCNGGNLFYWKKNGKYSLRSISLIWPILSAIKFNMPYGFIGQSFPGFDSGIAKFIFKYIFNKADFISVREPLSKKVIENITESHRKIHVGLDLSFHNLIKNKLKIHKDKSSKVIAVVLRSSLLGDVESKKYLTNNTERDTNVINYLKKIIENFQIPINIKVVIQHSIDKNISKKFLNEIDKNYMVGSTELILCYNFSDLIRIYENCDLLITYRFHAAIFGILAGTPTIGIYKNEYGPKMPGLFKIFNLEELCLKENDPFKLKYTIKELENKFKDTKKIISDQIKKDNIWIDHTFNRILNQ